MKNKITLLLIMVLIIPQEFIFSQGSGNCVVLDGSNDNIQLAGYPDMSAGNSFSITAWIMTTDNTKAGQRIFCDDQQNNSGCYALSLGDPGTGRLRFYVRGLNPVSLDVPSTSTCNIQNNKWYHVAAVFNGVTNTKYIYVNGILATSGTFTGSLTSCNGPASIGGETNGSPESSARFKGSIDEVTTWSKALTEAEIRNIMCKSQTGAESNLISYWRFDEGSGNIAFPTVVGNNGTLNNGPTWNTSGAALGSSVSYIFPSTWNGTSLSHASTEGDSVRISNVSGTVLPNGLFVYSIEATPNSVSGITGLGGNDHYFGVFTSCGTNVTYTIEYLYRENDAVQASPQIDESSLKLFSRLGNMSNTWTDAGAIVSLPAKSLSVVSAGSEFILGSGSNALPVELVSFHATLSEKIVILNWTTASELNNDYFTVERSMDGINFTELAEVKGAGTNNTILNYSAPDNNPLPGISYYRLKQTDYDGRSEYSEMVIVEAKEISETELLIYPNPTQQKEIQMQFEGFNGPYIDILVTDLSGRIMVKAKNFIDAGMKSSSVVLPDLNPGMYMMSVFDSQRSVSERLIIR